MCPKVCLRVCPHLRVCGGTRGRKGLWEFPGYCRTTGPGCPPVVVPWLLVLLSWGLVLLRDPSRLGHRDLAGHNHRLPWKGGDLQGVTFRGGGGVIRTVHLFPLQYQLQRRPSSVQYTDSIRMLFWTPGVWTIIGS